MKKKSKSSKASVVKKPKIKKVGFSLYADPSKTSYFWIAGKDMAIGNSVIVTSANAMWTGAIVDDNDDKTKFKAEVRFLRYTVSVDDVTEVDDDVDVTVSNGDGSTTVSGQAVPDGP